MITTTLSNTNPEDLTAMACNMTSCVVDVPSAIGLCACRCSNQCVFKLPVFALSGGTDKQNDKSDFLFRVVSSFDTGVLELWKYVGSTLVKQADLNTSTYGDYYPIGTFATTYGQNLYYGYLLDWETVLVAFGTGEYVIKSVATILSVAQTVNSDIYVLNTYTDHIVDGTFSMKTIQNGKIRRSSFDYTGLNWEQHIRLKGFFGFRTPELIKDRFLNEDYETTQIQDEIIDSYTLEINSFMDGVTCEDFIYSRIMANEIFITDSNRCTTEEICLLPVVVEEFSDTYEFRYHTGRAYEIKFKERAKDRFKRNYK